ncbi:hypothetical protein [Nonomuraea aurantiaca]|nr:hypothetical protein [Nonomuraea aurantiaca]
MTSIVNLFTQQPVDTHIWTALAWCVGLPIATWIFAMATYRRKIS